MKLAQLTRVGRLYTRRSFPQCLWPLFLLLCILLPSSAYAYIGPGAGFAFLGSTFVFLLTFVLAIATLALWPLQFLIRKIRRKGISKKARTRRVVILGLDGLEPSLVDRFITEGKLPHLQALKEGGSYHRLGTTLPSLSPVAWSTFQTGVNPGAHNIFDFLTRDKRTCLPELSSTEIEPGGIRIGIGKFSFKLGGPKIRIMRKSRPFWKILGEHGVFSNIIRIPISYPPEKFNGNILSAMCTPDLRGTQGTFSYFTSSNGSSETTTTGGERHRLEQKGSVYYGSILGPPHPKGKGNLTVPFSLVSNLSTQEATLKVGQEKIILRLNQFSKWVKLEFKASFSTRISGICRFCLRHLDPHIEIYISPINTDPEKPALPIAHPIYFSAWIAKKQGLYGTLGLMEDTWGRNELALDDQRFLDQTYLTHAEREKMFLEALEKTREGLCACVFDASDRIQHMFWRYLDPKHPSPLEEKHFANTIPEMYQKMDELVGKTCAQLRENDVIFVVSDHGFASFRRCLCLNTWLYREGYLAVKNDKVSGADYFQDVDWSRTRAFAAGLTGIYLNRLGRESVGIVKDEQVESLKREISQKLEALRDPLDNSAVIRKVYDTSKTYKGLYAEEAPDLIPGYLPGYRVSWDSVTGRIEPEVFIDNLKAWSGDHHIDPSLVPGIFFSNRVIKVADPHIMDIAPSVLDLFAVKVPAYMEGKVLL